MKISPAPAPTWRSSALFPHFGHFLSFFALISWNCSNAWPQAEQTSTLQFLGVDPGGLSGGVLRPGEKHTVVLNAVVFERFGSISQFVFELPLIERIPARFPKVATFFDLDHDAHDAAGGDEAAPVPEADPGA